MLATILLVALLGSCQILTTFAIAWCAWRYLERKQAAIEASLQKLTQEWLVPEADGAPHKLAQFIYAAGEVIGAAAAKSIMASLSAEKSHVARAANGMADELQGRANPLLGLFAGGKRGKGAALSRLMELIGPALMASGGVHRGSNGHGEDDVSNRIGKGM